MFRIHSDHGIQCVLPGFHCLPWDCRDQIYINILKSRLPCQIITLFKLPHRMYTPEQLQFLIIDRLQSKTDPVDPTCPVCLQIFFCDRTRIRFHRNFRICLDLKHIPERIKNFFHPTSRQNRWCSSSKKNRCNSIILCQLLILPDFCHKRCYIAIYRLPRSRTGQKITICTFFHTKRNMNI